MKSAAVELRSIWSSLRTAPRATQTQFEHAFGESRMRGETNAACAAWCGIVAARFHARQFAPDAVLSDGLSYVQRNFSRIEDALRGQVAVSICAALGLAWPEDGTYEDWERTALLHAQNAGHEVWIALGIVAAARTAWLGAPYERFITLAERIDAVVARLPDRSCAAGWVAAKLHCEQLYRAEHRRGKHESPMTEAAQLAMQSRDIENTSLAAAILLRNIVRGRLDEARAHLQRTARLASQLAPYDAWLLSFYKTWLSIEDGDDETAVLDAARGLAIAQRSGVPHAAAWAKFAAARAFATLPRARKQGRRLADAKQAARTIGSRPLLALCRLASALYAHARNQPSRAGRLAAWGLDMLEQSALLRPPLLSRSDLQRLFEDADHAGKDETAGTLRRLHGLTRQHAQTPAIRPDVQIHCLGRFMIVRDGQLLTWPRKAPRRPLDVLKAVIAHGAAGTSTQRLTDLLWASLDADNARKAFASALYRLRRMLGEHAIVLNGGHLRLAPDSTWIDAYAFEARAERDDPEALQLYTGHFLEEDEAGWIVSVRDRLREIHRRSLCRAGERLLADGRWREALGLYNSGLQRDDLAEMFFQGAIAACLAGGLRAEASTLYERCRSVLSEQLGLNPSPRTEELYRSVIRNV